MRRISNIFDVNKPTYLQFLRHRLFDSFEFMFSVYAKENGKQLFMLLSNHIGYHTNICKL